MRYVRQKRWSDAHRQRSSPSPFTSTHHPYTHMNISLITYILIPRCTCLILSIKQAIHSGAFSSVCVCLTMCVRLSLFEPVARRVYSRSIGRDHTKQNRTVEQGSATNISLHIRHIPIHARMLFAHTPRARSRHTNP